MEQLMDRQAVLQGKIDYLMAEYHQAERVRCLSAGYDRAVSILSGREEGSPCVVTPQPA